MDENLASGIYVSCILIFLTLNMSRSFGVIRCTFPKKRALLETNRIVEQNRRKFGPLFCLCTMYIGTFDLENVQVILGLFGAGFTKLARNSKNCSS